MKTADLRTVATEPGVPKPDPILIADGVRRSFGGLLAVDVEHLEIQRGAITALIGPNGAGKTTLFNQLSGFDSADAGTWALDGVDLSGRSPSAIARLGLVRTFQLTKSLSRLTVLDNMKLGARDHPGERILPALFPSRWRRRDQEIEDAADVLLARFQLDHLRDEFAGTLSGGQRKLLEMARALMQEPALLMLDEPMAGVNPALTQSLLSQITSLRDAGRTIVFVEHDMDMVMEISDWVVCMGSGQIIAEGPPEAVARNPAVVEAYLGSADDDQ